MKSESRPAEMAWTLLFVAALAHKTDGQIGRIRVHFFLKVA